MQLAVYAIGRKMPVWVQQACTDYSKRLPRRWQFSFREFGQAKGSNSDIIMAREADLLLSALPEKSHVIALDSSGNAWTTVQLARQLSDWQELGKNVVLIVGGADGLHASVKERADQQWSLSPLTFPHPLVRIILAEQLYRAQSVLDNHPYHRA